MCVCVCVCACVRVCACVCSVTCVYVLFMCLDVNVDILRKRADRFGVAVAPMLANVRDPAKQHECVCGIHCYILFHNRLSWTIESAVV